MAPKSSLLSHQPSKHKDEEDESEESSSGEEEEEKAQDLSDDETEADSSDDEAQNQVIPVNHKPPTPAPKLDPESDSGESGSDSDADSEELPSDYKLQPVDKGSEPSSKRSRDEIQNSFLGSRKSLRSEEKKSASASQSSPAGGIIRVWSNEDEIAVLNGMIEFKTVKGLDPNTDMGAFHTFVKGKLKADYSKEQLRNKMKGMKKRFVNALKKGVKGSDPVFSKPHEDLAFKISKKIWGEIKNGEKEVKKVEKDVVVEDEVVEREENGEGGDFWSKYPNINASFDSIKSSFPSLAHGGRVNMLKEKLSLIGNVKAKELDEKWKQLALEEVELSYKILTLMKEQVQMAMDQ